MMKDGLTRTAELVSTPSGPQPNIICPSPLHMNRPTALPIGTQRVLYCNYYLAMKIETECGVSTPPTPRGAFVKFYLGFHDAS